MSSMPKKPFNLAILGTRGIPANYGGFETFAQELSIRLARRGHGVTVFGRNRYVEKGMTELEGVSLRRLPALPHKYLDTVSHTALSMAMVLFSSFDCVLVCNAANAFLCWAPRLTGKPVVLNVDGIERLRKKWNRLGRAFYHLNERLAGWFANHVVTDARSIQYYYRQRYGLETTFIPYGASLDRCSGSEQLERLSLQSGKYLLYVSRFEPENNAHLVIEAYLESRLELPLVLVGDAPYSRRYIAQLRRLAEKGDARMPGAIYGRGYRQLLSHALCYIHATEVGGTHPALIEAMGAGCLVLVNDTPENREVMGGQGLMYPFNDRSELARLMRRVVEEADRFENLSEGARRRVREHYDWETITDQYEELVWGVLPG